MQQVALGQNDVDGEAATQLAAQFVQAVADDLDVLRQPPFIGDQQVGKAHRHQHPVEGEAGPVLFQHRQESGPLLAVILLGGVAPGGIEQHRLVGKPPVAVAGSAHPLDVDVAPLGVGEMQPRVAQQGAFSGRRRTDDHEPGEGVESGVAAIAHPQFGGFEGGDRLIHPLPEFLDIPLPAGSGPPLGLQFGLKPGGLAPHQQQPHQPDGQGQQQDAGNQGQAEFFTLQADGRAGPPDQGEEQQQTDQATAGAAEEIGLNDDQKLVHLVDPPLWVETGWEFWGAAAAAAGRVGIRMASRRESMLATLRSASLVKAME